MWVRMSADIISKNVDYCVAYEMKDQMTVLVYKLIDIKLGRGWDQGSC